MASGPALQQVKRALVSLAAAQTSRPRTRDQGCVARLHAPLVTCSSGWLWAWQDLCQAQHGTTLQAESGQVMADIPSLLHPCELREPYAVTAVLPLADVIKAASVCSTAGRGCLRCLDAACLRGSAKAAPELSAGCFGAAPHRPLAAPKQPAAECCYQLPQPSHSLGFITGCKPVLIKRRRPLTLSGRRMPGRLCWNCSRELCRLFAHVQRLFRTSQLPQPVPEQKLQVNHAASQCSPEGGGRLRCLGAACLGGFAEACPELSADCLHACNLTKSTQHKSAAAACS